MCYVFDSSCYGLSKYTSGSLINEKHGAYVAFNKLLYFAYDLIMEKPVKLMVNIKEIVSKLTLPVI